MSASASASASSSSSVKSEVNEETGVVSVQSDHDVLLRRAKCAFLHVGGFVNEMNDVYTFVKGTFVDRFIDLFESHTTTNNAIVQTAIVWILVANVVKIADGEWFEVSMLQHDVATSFWNFFKTDAETVREVAAARQRLEAVPPAQGYPSLAVFDRMALILKINEEEKDTRNPKRVKRTKRFRAVDLDDVPSDIQFTYEQLVKFYVACEEDDLRVVRLMALHMILRYFVGVGSIQVVRGRMPEDVLPQRAISAVVKCWPNWPIRATATEHLLDGDSDDDEQKEKEGEDPQLSPEY